jgi:hypothetical protein
MVCVVGNHVSDKSPSVCCRVIEACAVQPILASNPVERCTWIVLLVDDSKASSESMQCDVLMCWMHAEYNKARHGLEPHTHTHTHTQCSECVGARACMS